MKIFDYSIKETKEILDEFQTNSKTGLSNGEVQNRIKKYGFNELKSQKLNGVKIFFRQFNSSFIYLLLVAMAITLALGERFDALMIFIFLAINTFLGFYQEYRSEKTAQFLNKYS
ncbi:MAG: cation-transporting P-type ATPase, partial [bacterium]